MSDIAAGERAASNGAGSRSDLADVAARLGAAIKDELSRRIPRADLDERDPDYIRESLPGLWMLATIWFRGEVRGLENIPEEGPVLLVGNHSGGNVTPDTTVFTLAFNTYFGVERRFFQLAHNLVLAMPGLGYLRKYGTVAASPENAEKALSSGAALLVYPGGDWEVHRPTWEGHKVDFGGRKGFIRLALSKDVPIVPVVAIGGQETALFLSRGDRLARLLRARQAVSAQGAADLACAPVGAQHRRHAGPPPAAGEDHDPGAAADRPARGVRPRPRSRRGLRRGGRAHAADARRARGGAPPAGDRLMRIEECITVAAPPERVWKLLDDPDAYTRF